MSFPVHDWQFWSVTFAAVGAVWLLVRPFFDSADSPPSGACGNCPQASGERCGPGGGRERLVVLGGDR